MSLTHRATKVSLVTVFLAVLAMFVAWSFAGTNTANAASVTPTPVAGNPTCADYGYDFELKVDPPTSGDYDDDVLFVTVTFNAAGTSVDWTSNIGVDAVIVKGGNEGANLYVYDPPAESTGDTGLTNVDSSQQISHVSFCYDLELAVSKTAVTSFDRDFDWSITKESLEEDGGSAEDPFEVSENEDATLDYRVVVTKGAAQDSNFAVSGTITVTNPHPTLAAQSVNVSDIVTPGGIVAAVDCNGATAGTGLPATIAANGGVLNCTYSASLPNADTRTNTATATTTTTGIGTGTGTAAVTFGSTPTNVTDNCVNVSDTFSVGPNQQVCATTTFNYTVTILSEDLECGLNQIDNTAAVAATSDQEQQTASETVYVYKNCEGGGDGCTLTQGYWKNHADSTRKQFDATWTEVGGPNATFLWGLSYITVLNTSPQGNVWYILAHQYIAAILNQAAGADTTDIDADLAAALALLSGTSPTAAKSLKNSAKAPWITLANKLDDFNNGENGVGPGHCSSDPVV